MQMLEKKNERGGAMRDFALVFCYLDVFQTAISTEEKEKLFDCIVQLEKKHFEAPNDASDYMKNIIRAEVKIARILTTKVRAGIDMAPFQERFSVLQEHLNEMENK